MPPLTQNPGDATEPQSPHPIPRSITHSVGDIFRGLLIPLNDSHCMLKETFSTADDTATDSCWSLTEITSFR